jgi:hypothetical protein
MTCSPAPNRQWPSEPQQARLRREGADQYASDMLTRLAHLVAYDVEEVERGLESIGEE